MYIVTYEYFSLQNVAFIFTPIRIAFKFTFEYRGFLVILKSHHFYCIYIKPMLEINYIKFVKSSHPMNGLSRKKVR